MRVLVKDGKKKLLKRRVCYGFFTTKTVDRRGCHKVIFITCNNKEALFFCNLEKKHMWRVLHKAAHEKFQFIKVKANRKQNITLHLVYLLNPPLLKSLFWMHQYDSTLDFFVQSVHVFNILTAVGYSIYVYFAVSNSACGSWRASEWVAMIQIWDGRALQTVNDVMRQAQLAEKKRSNSVSAAWPGSKSHTKIS